MNIVIINALAGLVLLQNKWFVLYHIILQLLYDYTLCTAAMCSNERRNLVLKLSSSSDTGNAEMTDTFCSIKVTQISYEAQLNFHTI